MAKAMITIEQQLACVQREIKMRERVYPKWVGSGKMQAAKANYELQAMRAVAETLKGLQPNLFNEPDSFGG